MELSNNSWPAKQINSRAGDTQVTLIVLGAFPAAMLCGEMTWCKGRSQDQPHVRGEARVSYVPVGYHPCMTSSTLH